MLVDRGAVKAEDIALALQEQEKGDARRIGEILVGSGAAKHDDILAAQQVLDAKLRDTPQETIRVGINVLDKLMTPVGEPELAGNQLLQISNTVEDASPQAVSQRMPR